ncbi:hypothetical protein RCH18_000666 [Flavobacterium sp. PL11]|uniref:hypothetical protein n=1 Tax=Flavobacterium sp. PL11 TaxID=3071717 RepID=UPI002E08096C|nr:hypothetical protein [Flavobacterium sp. PL11]
MYKFKKENPELTNRLSITTKTLDNTRNWILLDYAIRKFGDDLVNKTTENNRYNGKSIYII